MTAMSGIWQTLDMPSEKVRVFEAEISTTYKAHIPQLLFILTPIRELTLHHNLAQQANAHVPFAKALTPPQHVMFLQPTKLVKTLLWRRVCVSIV